MSITRREFVKNFSATLAVGPLALAPRPPAKLARVGLELYSVRDAMKVDPEATLAKVRQMGYDDVELLWSFGNFGRTPQQVRATLDKEGLECPSGHIAPEALTTNWQKALDDARYVGHKYLIVPSLPAAANNSLDQWSIWADRFNNAGLLANKSGVLLAFHNEPNHQKPIGGQIPYDMFVERTDPTFVHLQLDIGNMIMGGGDPMVYLQKHAKRYRSFHIKDIVATRKNDTELGTGTVNIKRFLAAIPDLADKSVYVEQEGQTDPMGSAEKNCRFLKALEF